MGEVRIALDRIESALRAPVEKELQRRAILVTNVAKRLCPVDTGRLRSSIRWHPATGNLAHLTITVGTDVAYALWVHNGTPPHEIVPNEASVLHFKVGGLDVFAARVAHPGTKGVPFLTDALAAVLR